MDSNQFVANVGAKGRVTIPAEVRKHFGLSSSGFVSFGIRDDEDVVVSRAFPTIESLVGAAGKLDRHCEWHELIEIAREDWLMAHYGPGSEFAGSAGCSLRN